MLIGIPREIKDNEYRVGATPVMVEALLAAGHRVSVETKAGEKVGFSDDAYRSVGAKIVETPKEVYKSEMIIKVKEPQPSEIPLLREGQVLFGYLHLAADAALTEALVKKKIVGIAYETVTDSLGGLPLLQPMSEIAGRLSVQAGATALQMNNGGRGVLLGGVPGVHPAKVVVIGGGIVGTEAARMALGLGADVTILDRNLHRLRELDVLFGPHLKTLFSSQIAIEELLPHADLVVCSVLLPGKKAPKLISRALLKKMAPGSVIVDVSIDQGGCVEGAHPTTHSNPTFTMENVVLYCVANMPAACARTATQALTCATIDAALSLANDGWQVACRKNAYLAKGVNLCLGKVTNEGVAQDLGYPFYPVNDVMEW